MGIVKTANSIRTIVVWTSALLILICIGIDFARAGSGITYQGRIKKPDGSPLEGSNVTFKMQIRTPGSQNCLMYEEQQTLDMHNSNGLFNLTINSPTSVRTDSTGLTLDRIFGNRGTFNFTSGCIIGNSYSPNAEDGRTLVVSFKDETMGSFEQIPPTSLNFVPMAIEAQQVEGFKVGSLLRVQESDGTMGNISPLSNASYTDLLALIAGTSTQYVRNSTTAGARVPTYNGNPTSPVAGSIWLDTSSNQLKFRDSSGVQTIGTSSGGVTSVTAGSGLATTPAGGITSTGSIAIATGGVVSTMLADGSVITAKVADGAVTDVKLANNAIVTAKIADGAVTELKIANGSVTSAKIFDGTIAGGDLASNIVISTTGGITASGFTTTGTVTSNAVTATTVTATTVSSGVNVTRQIQLFDPDAGSTNKITFNADSALVSDYTLTWPLNDGAPNQLLTTDGSGNLTWTTISSGTGDFKADGTVPMTGALRLGGQWLSNDGGAEGIRIDNSGNVGVGTATPQELLDVAGAIRVGTTTTCGAPNPGTIRYNSGNLEYCNGTGWQVLGVSGSGITALTGDVAASGTGSVAATIAANAVTNAKMADNAIGNAELADNAVNTAELNDSAVTSTKIADGTIATADIASSAVTFAKVQDIATNKLVGRSTASSGPIEEISIGTGLSLSGGTLTASATGLPNCSDGQLAIFVTSAWTCVGAISANTASTVVRRDSSGNFVAGSATFTSSLILKDGATGGQVSIATPIGFSNYALTLPADDGTSGQVLSTDGSGVLSWSTPASGSGDFKADGTVAMTGSLRLNSNWLSNDGGAEGIRIDNSGNVGIGTASPQELLDVAGAIRVGTTTTCGAPNPGTIRYNSGNLEYCNGTGWQVLGVSGAGITALTGDVTASGSGSVAATIATGAVTNAKLGDNSVTSGKINDGTIVNVDLADNSVTSAKINDGSVSNADLADSIVSSAKIVDGAIATADVADKAITLGKIQDIATNKLLGRSTASNGPIEEISIGTGLSLSGGTLTASATGLPSCSDGQLAIYVTSAWTCVGAGSTNTASTVVRRDASGNFTAGSATLTTSLILKDGAAGGGVTIATPSGFTSYALTLPADDGTSNQVLTTNGAGVLSWSTPAAGGITALTGDVTASGTGSVAATIANNAVSSAKIADGTIATADVADSAITSLKIADGTIATADLASSSVTFAKMQDIATNKLVGRSTASAGVMEELSVGTGLSLSGGTLSATATGLPSCADGQLAIYVTSAWTCVGVTSANTASTMVRRDSSGNFVSGSATLTSSLVLKDGAAGGQVSIATPVGFANYSLTLPVDDGASGQVLTTNGSGVLSWSSPASGSGTGDFKADGTVPMAGNLQLNNNWLSNDGGAEGIRVDNSGNVGIGTGSPSGKLDVAAGTVTTNTPIFNATETWNNVATTFTGFLMNVTDSASSGTSKLMDLQVGGVSKFSVDKTGKITGDGSGLTGVVATPSQPRVAFLTSGTSWTTPAGITTSSTFKITLIGGGGGGGGAKYASSWTVSAGGGAGAVAIWYVSGLNPNTAYSYAIGAAGTAGAVTPTSGGNGGSTTITINGTTITAGGGSGGSGNGSGSTNALGGAGGTVTGTPTIAKNGQMGGSAFNAIGAGASGQFGSGGMPPPSGSGQNFAGNSGSGYGSGGSGAIAASNNSAYIGGAGTQGAILIEWQE